LAYTWPRLWHSPLPLASELCLFYTNYMISWNFPYSCWLDDWQAFRHSSLADPTQPRLLLKKLGWFKTRVAEIVFAGKNRFCHTNCEVICQNQAYVGKKSETSFCYTLTVHSSLHNEPKIIIACSISRILCSFTFTTSSRVVFSKMLGNVN